MVVIGRARIPGLSPGIYAIALYSRTKFHDHAPGGTVAAPNGIDRFRPSAGKHLRLSQPGDGCQMINSCIVDITPFPPVPEGPEFSRKRSEERRVGKECRSRRWRGQWKKERQCGGENNGETERTNGRTCE